jgi:hypothetical protein
MIQVEPGTGRLRTHPVRLPSALSALAVRAGRRRALGDLQAPRHLTTRTKPLKSRVYEGAERPRVVRSGLGPPETAPSALEK